MLNVENLIIGAGISGLTFAANCKEDYLIVEKESHLNPPRRFIEPSIIDLYKYMRRCDFRTAKRNLSLTLDLSVIKTVYIGLINPFSNFDW